MGDSPDSTICSPALAEAFLTVPLAHRGLHSVSLGRIENSSSAALAAIAAGYGIELDLQLSRDGVAMVFHDETLSRLTARRGWVRDYSAEELGRFELSGGNGDTIPTLAGFLDLVAGQVPVLIELKDQSGCFGEEPDTLARSVALALADYNGPVATMSFNPHIVAHLARLAPNIPRGLATKRFRSNRNLSRARAAELNGMNMFDQIGASFISHDRRGLGTQKVLEMRARGVPVLTWTVRSARQEQKARRIAANITFEGYTPEAPPTPTA
ncbi:MAG: glycerophosphodiester phosphodiesterase family protein [Dinoroseobacter sp.]|nr:glycerophosphodiester phosphodiesterase family protein [Dinoroseobacter sp.]